MKIRYPTLYLEKRRSSTDSAEAGYKWTRKLATKSCSVSNCLIIVLPVLAFLSLGIYFILFDLHVLSPPEKTIPSNDTNSSFVAWDSDQGWLDGGTDPPDFNGSSVGGVLEQGRTNSSTTTTQKPFAYSPTVPLVTRKQLKPEATTRNQGPSEGSECFSTRLGFCEGVLPYDLVRLPDAMDSATLDSLLPAFRRIIESNCSSRAREIVCSVLEPECSLRPSLPCRTNCRALSEDCGRFIALDPRLSEMFNCRDGASWDDSADCLDMFAGNCRHDEYNCGRGKCVPMRWICDGSVDCRQTEADEVKCQKCAKGSFRCEADERCIPRTFLCDGEPHCSDGSDEFSC